MGDTQKNNTALLCKIVNFSCKNLKKKKTKRKENKNLQIKLQLYVCAVLESLIETLLL